MILKLSRVTPSQKNGQTMEPLDVSTLVATTTKESNKLPTPQPEWVKSSSPISAVKIEGY